MGEALCMAALSGWRGQRMVRVMALPWVLCGCSGSFDLRAPGGGAGNAAFRAASVGDPGQRVALPDSASKPQAENNGRGLGGQHAGEGGSGAGAAQGNSGHPGTTGTGGDAVIGGSGAAGTRGGAGESVETAGLGGNANGGAGGDGTSGSGGTAGSVTGDSGAAAGAGNGASGTSAAGAGSGGNAAAAGDGAAGGSGASGTGGAAPGSGGTGSVSYAKEPKIPAAQQPCPTLATGNITVLGQNVTLAVGAKSAAKTGPVFFYWHGTGSTPQEAGVLGAAIDEIVNLGGLVASFDTTTGQGSNTGNAVWYTGDFKMADEILACAIQQLNIDVHRIYTGGCSAGGLQASAMLYQRSSYLAAVMPNSGGTIFGWSMDDASHVPALITTHGKMGTDVVTIDFSTTSLNQCHDVAAKGGFVVDCDHGGGHCGAPPEVIAAQWQFLKDHPFGYEHEPYATALPASFPSYCQIIR